MPILLLLVFTTVLSKSANTAVTSEEKDTSNHAEEYLADKNSTNFTTSYYGNPVNNQNNIRSTDDIRLKEKTSTHVDLHQLNNSTTYFSNDRDDMNGNTSTDNTYLNDVNSSVLLNTKFNESKDEKNRGLPEEIAPSFGFDKKERKVNVHTRDRDSHRRSDIDSFNENKKDYAAENHEEFKLSERDENLVDDENHNDQRYFDDSDDKDEDYDDDDYEFDDDIDMKDNEEFGIRDSLDDLIRKTVTGRDSILRRIFSRRRFFRRIIDK